MNMHKNARLTPSGRVLLVERIEGGWTVKQASAAAGVSERTACRWLGRYRCGERQLADRSSAPRHVAHRLPSDRIAAVERLRRQRQTRPAIARALGMARSSVGLVLRRLGLNRLDRLQPGPPVIRYERQRPGEMIHLDMKTLGRIARPSHRVTGDRRDSVEGVGWERLHVAVDDASRLACNEVLPASGKKMPPPS